MKAAQRRKPAKGKRASKKATSRGVELTHAAKKLENDQVDASIAIRSNVLPSCDQPRCLNDNLCEEWGNTKEEHQEALCQRFAVKGPTGYKCPKSDNRPCGNCVVTLEFFLLDWLSCPSSSSPTVGTCWCGYAFDQRCSFPTRSPPPIMNSGHSTEHYSRNEALQTARITSARH